MDVPFSLTIYSGNSLIIVLSQSGETMDLIEAIKHTKEKGATVASLVNVPFCTVQRMSDISINVMAGQEICVAATKSYINQCITLLALSSMFKYSIDLANIPSRINQTIKNNIDKVKKLANKIYKQENLYVLGRGICYSAAAEIALKVKEISYIHAEGFAGGELKHGPIALIQKGTPCISKSLQKEVSLLSSLVCHDSIVLLLPQDRLFLHEL